MSTRLLIIDDDPEITSALARGLALHGYEAETENRAGRGLERLQDGEFAAAIVDVMLGQDSGLDLVREARAAGVTLPILMLSALTEVEDRAAGLEAGADDYVVKPFHFDELVARLRVQEHRAGGGQRDPARLSRATRTLNSRVDTVTFTEREFELLELLAKTGETPLSRGAIFDALWATEGSSSENVVDVYVGYVRKKLQSRDFRFEIKTVRNKGFCLTGQLPILDDAGT